VALLTLILSICFSTNEISIDLKFNNIILTDDDRIVNDQTEVAETFNECFVNVAKDIGKDSCAVNQEHPSVKVISEHN
jgi:hypothetical protein